MFSLLPPPPPTGCDSIAAVPKNADAERKERGRERKGRTDAHYTHMGTNIVCVLQLISQKNIFF